MTGLVISLLHNDILLLKLHLKHYCIAKLKHVLLQQELCEREKHVEFASSSVTVVVNQPLNTDISSNEEKKCVLSKSICNVFCPNFYARVVTVGGQLWIRFGVTFWAETTINDQINAMKKRQTFHSAILQWARLSVCVSVWSRQWKRKVDLFLGHSFTQANKEDHSCIVFSNDGLTFNDPWQVELLFHDNKEEQTQMKLQLYTHSPDL